MASSGRAQAFNYYQRRTGLTPTVPGRHPAPDAAKAQAMGLALPVRGLVGRGLRTMALR